MNQTCTNPFLTPPLKSSQVPFTGSSNGSEIYGASPLAMRTVNAGFILDRSAFKDIYGDELYDSVATEGNVLGPPITVEELNSEPPDWLQDMDVLFTGWGSPRLDEEMLARMPRLRAVFYGAGTLRFTVTDACWPRGIVF